MFQQLPGGSYTWWGFGCLSSEKNIFRLIDTSWGDFIPSGPSPAPHQFQEELRLKGTELGVAVTVCKAQVCFQRIEIKSAASIAISQRCCIKKH